MILGKFGWFLFIIFYPDLLIFGAVGVGEGSALRYCFLFIYLFIIFFFGGGGGIENVFNIGRSTASVRQPTNFAFKCIQVFCGHRIIGLTISSIFFLLAIVENSR